MIKSYPPHTTTREDAFNPLAVHVPCVLCGEIFRSKPEPLFDANGNVYYKLSSPIRDVSRETLAA